LVICVKSTVYKFKILGLWNWLAYMHKLRFFSFWTRRSTLYYSLVYLYTIQSLDFWNCFLCDFVLF